MKVVDNFLPKEDFLKIQSLLSSWDFPWYYQNKISIEIIFFHEIKLEQAIPWTFDLGCFFVISFSSFNMYICHNPDCCFV